MTREEHLQWCKDRALEYVENGDITSAWGSMVSDLNKHDGTRGHSAIQLGMMMVMSGNLKSKDEKLKASFGGANVIIVAAILWMPFAHP